MQKNKPKGCGHQGGQTRFHNSRLNEELNIKAKSSFFLKANDSSPFVTVIFCGVKLVTFFEGWVKGSISRLRLLSVHDGLKQFL